MDLARFLASRGYQPNQGNDVADFTAPQRAAMDMRNQASAAFGFAPAAYGGPTGATVGPNGTLGFSTHDIMKQNSPNYDDQLSFLSEFARMAGGGQPASAAGSARGTNLLDSFLHPQAASNDYGGQDPYGSQGR